MPQDTTHSSKPTIMNLALYVVSFLPLTLLLLVFGWHAVMGLIGHQDLHDIIAPLGFGELVTSVLVFLAGVHDGVVTALLVTKNALFPSLPFGVVFLYAGLWPIVPRGLIWYGGGSFEWIEVLIFAGIASLAYWAHTTRSSLRPRATT